MLNYIFQYKFTLLMAMAIALLSLLPDSSLPDSSLFSIRFLDKIVHFSMYTAISFVALLESRCRDNNCQFRHLLILSGILMLSALIEVLQATLIASRSAEWLDLVANGMGLVSGYIAYRLFLLIRS